MLGLLPPLLERIGKHIALLSSVLNLSLSLSLPLSLPLPSRPVLMMVGQAQQDIASQLAQYEITISHDIITEINAMLEVSKFNISPRYQVLTTIYYYA